MVRDAQPRWRRPALRLQTLNLCVALWLLTALNVPFWWALRSAFGSRDAARGAFQLTLPLLALAIVWLTLELLTWGRTARYVLAALLLISAAAAYFMWSYGIVFDRAMIGNLVETDLAETRELLTWRLMGWMAVFGLLPVLLLALVEVPALGWSRQAVHKAAVFVGLVASVALLVAPFVASYAALLRNHRDLRLLLLPTNYLYAAQGYARIRLATPTRIEQVGADARRAPAAAGSRPRVVLLVIGETARAANFALSGYARDTNPALSRERDLVNLTRVTACGTSTAVSLPCMFLDVGRAKYRDGMARKRENLLDVLQRAGVGVYWLDNNSGCKGLCDRVPNEKPALKRSSPPFCNEGGCWDEILLDGLQRRLDAIERDTVIVLHPKGSHGPAYYMRVPPAFEHFKPACRTNQLDRCSRESIVNAYDNTLRYTDHVLASAIGMLRRNEARLDSAMIYVSDHGESLGENGLYLHGLPFMLAPREQTHVPMLLWLPPRMLARTGIGGACLERRAGVPYSHDNLYHSMLGLLDVQTGLYRRDRDLFAACRTRPSSS